MNRPYNTKPHYDPGRLDYKVRFIAQRTNPNGLGGTQITQEEVLSTWAARRDISEYDPVVMRERVSSIDGSCYFIIRARKDFNPEINMLVENSGDVYTIQGIKNEGQPVTHVKLLCAYKDSNYDIG